MGSMSSPTKKKKQPSSVPFVSIAQLEKNTSSQNTGISHTNRQLANSTTFFFLQKASAGIGSWLHAHGIPPSRCQPWANLFGVRGDSWWWWWWWWWGSSFSMLKNVGKVMSQNMGYRDTQPETNKKKTLLKIGHLTQKGSNYSLPTIHFSGAKILVFGGRVSCVFQRKQVNCFYWHGTQKVMVWVKVFPSPRGLYLGSIC